MGFRDHEENQSSFYDLVRVNRATGGREVVRERDSFENRWAADSALRKILEQNRDPTYTYEVQPTQTTRKKFRAAAFGDATERIQAFRDPNDSDPKIK